MVPAGALPLTVMKASPLSVVRSRTVGSRDRYLCAIRILSVTPFFQLSSASRNFRSGSVPIVVSFLCRALRFAGRFGFAVDEMPAAEPDIHVVAADGDLRAGADNRALQRDAPRLGGLLA